VESRCFGVEFVANDTAYNSLKVIACKAGGTGAIVHGLVKTKATVKLIDLLIINKLCELKLTLNWLTLYQLNQ